MNVIPKPVKARLTGGAFELTPNAVVSVQPDSPELRAVAEYFAELIAPATGMRLAVTHEARAGGIALKLDPGKGDLGDEGYTLSATSEGVTITAPTAAGVFYGVQTLRQLLPTQIESTKRVRDVSWTVPCVEIEDRPRFRWRGMMLDCCRHFFPKEFILKYIDLLALHKMNRFHWHLTEDQGWRIEIGKYPKLAEISAWRDEDGKRYGGIYTRDDVKEIVAYAARRHVTVVPEIELPGHAQAALAAYPELSCTGGPFEVSTKWGVRKDVYCAGNEAVFEFLENVLTEVTELFPSEYIHIGGDECPKHRWKECPKCRKRIADEGLKDEHELQSWFIRRIEKFLNSKGRRLIGWDEILEGGLAPDATVQSWRGTKGGIAAARAGHDVIMSPMSHCYFDFYQGPPSREPKAIGGFVSLRQAYSYEPVPEELTAAEAPHVLGLQGNVWTEYIPTCEQVDYMTHPRAAALAEVGWSPPETRDFDDFRRRLASLVERFDLMGVNYRVGPEWIKAGKWTPENTPEAWTALDWDVTEATRASGGLEVLFTHAKGEHGLAVGWVALLEDGNEIARDTHDGTAGPESSANAYALELKEHKPGASYVIRASVRGDGGTDSHGTVWFGAP